MILFPCITRLVMISLCMILINMVLVFGQVPRLVSFICILIMIIIVKYLVYCYVCTIQIAIWLTWTD